MQPQQAAPIALVGPRLGSGPRELRQSLLLAQMHAAFGARRRLEIMRLRFGSGPATLRKPQDFEFGDDSLQGQAEAVADPDTVRRLHPLGIQVHFAAADRGARHAACFVKTGIPQPFIQAVTIEFVIWRHVRCCPISRRGSAL
jgi:hypothetical protein